MLRVSRNQASYLKFYNQHLKLFGIHIFLWACVSLGKDAEESAVGCGVSACHFAPLGFYQKENRVNERSLTVSYNLGTWQFKHTSAWF